ncbi:universal stress protein [Streptomyces sp. MMBL 11-3]|uniref:universal stress protein n=1 Tax=Streptomyces sp. MMBL 11-3 TaxID=3382639 RepID=UPI0039B3D67A
MERVIVTGVDRSPRSVAAAEWAAREALRRALPLRVLHVSPPPGLVAAECWPDRTESVADHVAAHLAARHPGLRVEGFRLAGPVVPALGSQSGDAEMLVLGLRGEGGFAGLAVGSTALAAAAAVDRPVVLVPTGSGAGRRARRPDKVTLAVDARAPVDGTVDFAFDTARLHGARLHAVHVGPPPPAGAAEADRAVSASRYAARVHREMELLAGVLRPWREKYPSVRVLEDVVLSAPVRALVRASGSAELLVVGRQVGGGLGPVAHALVHLTSGPVAVVP